ncbi:hypothetical protein EC912_101720 [Luteibacter rhizovicinus]|uniref:Uncharacterized protein n=1 Tax=Luteibacter rhizovicinus TaxID=242606 RepID=A0A4R3Z1N3_9GAMM|nr:hypothetical protein [Luteibacter rhizovicinus]TCV97703.1 hypothetical protein EC912_101720 [Luteibacter rhizovicinus]
MDQLNVVMHEKTENTINPFGILMEGPLQIQMAAGKRAPKTIDPTDVGGFGGRGGGDG